MQVDLIISQDAEVLLPFLHEADEDDERIRVSVAAHTGYLASSGGKPVGAAVMRWDAAESELIYIGVDSSERGRGYGKAIVVGLLDEAGRRQVKAVLVGAANAGLENIAFYQKCGFRMDSIRKDYFDYFAEPVYENGIRIQDILMLRWTAPGEG